MENFKNYPERTKNIEPFIYQYNWDEINFPSDQKIGKNLSLIRKQLFLIFCMCPTILKKIRHA